METYRLVPLFDKFEIHGITFTQIDYEKFISRINGIEKVNDVVFSRDCCYLWKPHGRTVPVKGGNHGTFKTSLGALIPAHRVMYILYKGIPEDLVGHDDLCPCESGHRYQSCCHPEVTHQCVKITGKDSDGRCVNPLHLELGNRKSNQHDIRVHGTGRGKIHKGNDHPCVSITEEKAREIWKDKLTGMPLKRVAELHEVKHSFVKDMSCGRTWNDITGIPNTKRIENVKKQKEKKYNKELQRKQDVLELKKLQSIDKDVAVEIPPIIPITSKICRGVLCIAEDPDGVEKAIGEFGWKTKKHGARRSTCAECKGEQQIIDREKSRKRKQRDEYPKEQKQFVNNKQQCDKCKDEKMIATKYSITYIGFSEESMSAKNVCVENNLCFECLAQENPEKYDYFRQQQVQFDAMSANLNVMSEKFNPLFEQFGTPSPNKSHNDNAESKKMSITYPLELLPETENNSEVLALPRKESDHHVEKHTWNNGQSHVCLECHMKKPASQFPFHNKKEMTRLVYCNNCWNSKKSKAQREEKFLCQKCIAVVPISEKSSNGIWCRECRRIDERERTQKTKEREKMEIPAGHRLCEGKCKKVKPNSEFASSSGSKCWDCRDTVAKESRRKWYHANKGEDVGTKVQEKKEERLAQFEEALETAPEKGRVECRKCKIMVPPSEMNLSRSYCNLCNMDYDGGEARAARTAKRKRMAQNNEKTCPDCGYILPLVDFASNRVDAKCKECKKKSLRKASAKNREKNRQERIDSGETFSVNEFQTEKSDKFSSAQRELIGMIIPEEDMPFTISSKPGIRPDFIVNPKCSASKKMKIEEVPPKKIVEASVGEDKDCPDCLESYLLYDSLCDKHDWIQEDIAKSRANKQ